MYRKIDINNKMAESNKLQYKKLKTIQEINNDSPLEKEENLSNNQLGNIINITINNNYSIKKRTSLSNNKNSNRQIFRNKTFFNDISQKNHLESYIKEISSKNIKHLNININYNKYQRKSASSVEKKRIDSLWTKTKIFQKMLNAFMNPDVVKIDDKDIFSETLKTTLLDNNNYSFQKKNIKDNNIKKIKFEEKIENKRRKKEITLEQFLRKSEVEKELIRVNLKEKAFKLITEGISNNSNKNIIEEFEKLFYQNPEKNKYSPEDKNYLFNQRLSNGKTLLYIACQEGNTEIVKFLLEKKLNPNIKAIYFDMEDSCLAVAVRWNFFDIVKLILESNKIYEEDIYDILNQEKCSLKIKNLILNFIPDDKKQKCKGCGCF
jgi:hypothetical protein